MKHKCLVGKQLLESPKTKTKLLERKNKLGKFKTDLNFMNINFFSSLKLQDMPHKHMILYLYRKEWAFTLLSFLRHFPAKNWVGLRKPIRYVQIDIRNNLFISQFVDTKFRDLLICKCVQNNPTGRVGRKVKREKSQRAIARWDFSRCAFRLKSVVLLQTQLVGTFDQPTYFWIALQT